MPYFCASASGCPGVGEATATTSASSGRIWNEAAWMSASNPEPMMPTFTFPGMRPAFPSRARTVDPRSARREWMAAAGSLRAERPYPLAAPNRGYRPEHLAIQRVPKETDGTVGEQGIRPPSVGPAELAVGPQVGRAILFHAAHRR